MRVLARAGVPLVLVAGLVGAGVWMDRHREERRSVLSGVFESEPTVLSARVTGRVKEILVREGEPVRPGQIVVRLEAEPALLEADAQAALAEQAESVRQEVEQGPRQEAILEAQAVVVELSANLRRLRAGPTPEARRAMAARVASVRARYQAALAGARPEEIERARAVEAEARSRLEAAQRGPTVEERRQAAARLEATRAAEILAEREVERATNLYARGALARRDLERAQAAAKAARAAREEAEAAKERIDRGTPDEELRQVEAAHRAAQASLRLLESGTRAEDRDAARAELAAAEAEQRDLENGTRPEDIAAASARLAQAEARLAALKSGNRPEALSQARASARAARLRADEAATLVADRAVGSPLDGVVDRVLVAKGDLVQAGSPIVRVTDPTDLWIRIYVPESGLADWTVGRVAHLWVDGVREALEARVENVAAQGEFTPANLQSPEDRGCQVFAVRLRLVRSDRRVKAGMAASVATRGRL